MQLQSALWGLGCETSALQGRLSQETASGSSSQHEDARSILQEIVDNDI